MRHPRAGPRSSALGLRQTAKGPESEGGGGSSPTASSCCSSKATKLVVMGHEDIVWEEDLTIRVLCWSWGILSPSDRRRLLSRCRLGSGGVSEADATRGFALVIAGGTLARCHSPLLESERGLTSGLGGCKCGRGQRRYLRLDDAFGLGSCWGGDRNRGLDRRSRGCA